MRRKPVPFAQEHRSLGINDGALRLRRVQKCVCFFFQRPFETKGEGHLRPLSKGFGTPNPQSAAVEIVETRGVGNILLVTDPQQTETSIQLKGQTDTVLQENKLNLHLPLYKTFIRNHLCPNFIVLHVQNRCPPGCLLSPGRGDQPE